MNKIKYFFLLLSFLMGVNVANAYVHFQGEQISQLQNGDTIAIKGACWSNDANAQKFMAATANSLAITDSAMYVVEDAGEVDGAQAWYFRNISRNEYISYNYPIDEMGAFNNVTYSKEIRDAAPFWVMIADTMPAAAETPAHYVQDTRYSYIEVNEQTVTITYAKDVSAFGDAKYWWLSNLFGGSGPMLSTYADTNICNLYRTTSGVDAQQTLLKLLEEYPDGVENLYTAGTTIGCVPQEYIDALITAYGNALTSLEGGSNAEKLAAYDALSKALQDCKDNIVDMKEGYYSFEGLSDNAPRRGVMYVDGTNAMWENIPTDSVISEPKHIWKVSLRRVVDGVSQYDMQNVLSGYYMTGTQTSTSAQVPVGPDTTTNAMVFTPAENGYFFISSSNPDKQDNYKYFHLNSHGSSGANIVLWTNSDASKWYIRPIDESVVKAMEDKVKQVQLNNKLQALLDEALPKLQMSRKYILPDDVKADLDYSNEGLVSEVDQIWSNALLEGAGLGYEALVNGFVKRPAADNDWFHSIWSGSVQIEGYHNLQMHLSKPVSCVAFKMSPRLVNANNAVTDATVYACNDTTGGDKWVQVGKLSSIFVANTDSVAITPSIEMGAEYEFIRFDVTKTVKNALYNGVPNFAMGEFHAYESVYDPTNSQYEVIANADAFKAAIAKATQELAAAKGTQATLDELQAEYDAFIAVLADPTLFDDKAEEAKQYIDNAQVGDDPGYVSDQAAIDALQVAVDAARATITPQSNKSVIEDAIASVDAAIATFKTSINKLPLDSWFFIQSKTSATPADMAMYVKVTNSGFDTRWSGKDTIAKDGTLAAQINSLPEYMWRLVATDYSDSVYVQNFGTGLYLTAGAGMTADPTCIGFDFPSVSGIFNIVLSKNDEGESQFLNASPADAYDGNVVSWGEANVNGTDNSAWKFVPVTVDFDQDPMLKTVEAQKLQFITSPYAITGYGYTGVLYSVDGIKDGNLILTEIDPDIDNPLAAGTPIVIDMTKATEDDVTENFYISSELVSKPLTVNGVVGTYESMILPQVGAGYLSEGKIMVTVEDKAVRISPYTAYIDANVPTVATDGDLQIPIEGVITGIENVKVINAKGLVNVYTAAGVLLRKNVKAADATKNLPAGIYVVGNEKVVVK